MKVTITFTSTNEDDGFYGSTTVVREDVDDLHALSAAYGDATRAAGFTYVDNVGFEKDDGSMIFSDW
tara:strand:- start:568 stop:768 length:201 start_codon:yes stop_codon:yes gene_type:complete